MSQRFLPFAVTKQLNCVQGEPIQQRYFIPIKTTGANPCGQALVCRLKKEEVVNAAGCLCWNEKTV